MNKNKAIFLDRDGVINKNKINYVTTVEELEILPSIGNSIKKLKNNNYFVIVITNQSPINRKLMTHEQLNKIHSSIQKHLEFFDTSIDKFYFCPHMPQENCNCRKPKAGMLLQAISEFNIEPTLSWMIGDNDSDVQAGLTAGCRTLKIDNDTNLQLAVDKILNL
ncbi:HAD family hydrolase [Nitrosopumilus sp.]|jgi:D-glycero-D-manno-heptose 1,7-bisphosphate phosphatase|nr:HAD family hydrolase [Nitrosopumilus sp.]